MPPSAAAAKRHPDGPKVRKRIGKLSGRARRRTGGIGPVGECQGDGQNVMSRHDWRILDAHHRYDMTLRAASFVCSSSRETLGGVSQLLVAVVSVPKDGFSPLMVKSSVNVPLRGMGVLVT